MMARAALNNLANATVGRSAQIPHAARPSLGARCNRYRAALRLGWRDALRHKARTLLSLLLVMLPIAAMVASIGMTTTIPPTRSRALATIPADTQAVITATGMDTEMGKIAGVLAQTEQEQTPLQRKLNELGKTMSKLVLGICVFIFIFDLVVAGEFTLDTVLSTFMVAVSLAVAAIPEGLATVVTVVLSIGVTNMSKQHAVIRRLTAVETLGCTQVICSDKTGTLTQNKMTVVEHTGPTELLATAMALCNDAALEENGAIGEPTEAALVNFAAAQGLKKPVLESRQPRCGEAPFDSGRKMMSTIHRTDTGFIQYTKGAPDEVLRRCTHYTENGQVLPMTEAKRTELLAANKAMADKALRVLAAAERLYESLPDRQEPEDLEHDLCFIGLCGMIDPVRPEVKAAVAECRAAGIRPVMITGDHKITATAIAEQIGIFSEGDMAVTGQELDAMSEEELDQKNEELNQRNEELDQVKREAAQSAKRGELTTLIRQCVKKMQKGTSVEDIADMLEEDFSVIQSICNIAEKYAPEYEVEKICNEVENML